MDNEQIGFYKHIEVSKHRNTGSNIKKAMQLRGVDKVLLSLNVVESAIDDALRVNGYNTYAKILLKQCGDNLDDIRRNLESIKIFIKKPGRDKHYTGD